MTNYYYYLSYKIVCTFVLRFDLQLTSYCSGSDTKRYRRVRPNRSKGEKTRYKCYLILSVRSNDIEESRYSSSRQRKHSPGVERYFDVLFQITIVSLEGERLQVRQFKLRCAIYREHTTADEIYTFGVSGQISTYSVVTS